MKNLDSVFAAYLIGWGIFFVFYLTIARRTSALRDDIERLKNSVESRQVAWQGRSESASCCSSLAGRIRCRPSSHFC